MTEAKRRYDKLTDVTTAEFGADAIAGYDRIRREARLSWLPWANGWLVTGYADAAQALRNKEFVEADLSVTWRKLQSKFGKDYQPMLDLLSFMPFQHEGVRHEQLRRTIASAIAPFASRHDLFAKRIAAMLREARQIGGFDMAKDFARSVMFEIFCDLMEVPEADRGELRDMSRVSFLPEPTLSVQKRDHVVGAISKSVAYLTRHAQRQVESGRPCLVSLIHKALPPDEPDKFNATASIASIMLDMGNDALGSCISHGVWQMLGGDGSSQQAPVPQTEWASASDDVIRYAAPVDLIARVMQTDGEVAGCPFKAGTTFVISALAANHDPEEFGANANQISPHGPGGTGLAFGAGTHVCVGSRIGRNIAKEAFTALERLPPLRAAGNATYTSGTVVRVISSLPVEFV